MFVVIVTGAAGVGKTTYLTALTDVLADDDIAHATIDADDVSWAYPYPDLEARAAVRDGVRGPRTATRATSCCCSARWWSRPSTSRGLLGAVEADDHLLVRLTAPYMLLRQRILAREPVEWSGTQHLLEETRRWVQRGRRARRSAPHDRHGEDRAARGGRSDPGRTARQARRIGSRRGTRNAGRVERRSPPARPGWRDVAGPGDSPRRDSGARGPDPRHARGGGASFVDARRQPDDALTAVHDEELIDHLERAWADWRQAGLDMDPGQDRVVPYLFPHPGLFSGQGVRTATSITARAGQFGYDTLTAVGPGTLGGGARRRRRRRDRRGSGARGVACRLRLHPPARPSRDPDLLRRARAT